MVDDGIGQSTGWEVSQRNVVKILAGCRLCKHTPEDTPQQLFLCRSLLFPLLPYTHYYIMHSISTLMSKSPSKRYTGMGTIWEGYTNLPH